MKLIPDISSFVESTKKRNSTPKSSVNALELAITAVILIVIGRFIDVWLGTSPIFILIFTVLGVVGSIASGYYRYMYTAQKLEEEKVWTRETEKKSIEIIEDKPDALEIPKGYGAQDE